MADAAAGDVRKRLGKMNPLDGCVRLGVMRSARYENLWYPRGKPVWN